MKREQKNFVLFNIFSCFNLFFSHTDNFTKVNRVAHSDGVCLYVWSLAVCIRH